MACGFYCIDHAPSHNDFVHSATSGAVLCKLLSVIYKLHLVCAGSLCVSLSLP